MRAVTFREPGRVGVAEIPDPELEDAGDAIVRVTASAVCGSDLHFLHGKAPLEPGDVMGHEAVGVVERVGERVERFSPGDRVVVAFVIACGACWFCRRGESALCEDFRNLGAGVFGGGLAGAQAERLRVPVADVNLLRIPDAVGEESALFVSDILTTAVHAVERAEIGGEDTVAVVGAGPVGTLIAHATSLVRHARTLVVDVDAARLQVAASFGATPIDASATNAQIAVASRTGDRGADVVFDAVGSPAAFERSLDLVRRGGRVVVVGVYAGELAEAQLGVWWVRALDLRFIGVCPVHAVWERAMAHLEAGRLDPSPLISHRMSLEDAAEAYELFDTRRATKVILRP
jgi:2-desacetyl-2-hydroxyethyl bacteriochlorophyllide A dehydrogenase